MSDVTLYKICLRRVCTNLGNRFYINYNENPFERLPSTIANAIISAAWDQIPENNLRIDTLVKLLESKTLTELKISNIRASDSKEEFKLLNQILEILSYFCENLQALHLFGVNEWVIYKKGRTVFNRVILQALKNLLPNTLQLKYLECQFHFNLNALKNCRKLRKLSLHFRPQEQWHEFLDRENEGNFLKHECLKYFTVCPKHVSENVHYPDIVTILQHCPELISLGLIESSRALSQLYRISSSKLKLRHCYWKEMESPNNGPHEVGNAVRICPLIEDLKLDNCNSRSLPCLRNLKNLACLSITLDASVTSDDINNALREIGPYLKHLSFKAAIPMDISLLLQNCYNLESLRMFRDESSEFSYTSVELPKLQRLTMYSEDNDYKGRFFSFLRRCNHLTDLFLVNIYFDDERLCNFLVSNSLSNLKVAYFNKSNLTEHGFRQLLQKAPGLEKVHIHAHDNSYAFVDIFRTVITETHHTVNLFVSPVFLIEDEFFVKRQRRHVCPF